MGSVCSRNLLGAERRIPRLQEADSYAKTLRVSRRDAAAMQAKLNEIVVALEATRNDRVGLERVCLNKSTPS